MRLFGTRPMQVRMQLQLSVCDTNNACMSHTYLLLHLHTSCHMHCFRLVWVVSSWPMSIMCANSDNLPVACL